MAEHVTDDLPPTAPASWEDERTAVTLVLRARCARERWKSPPHHRRRVALTHPPRRARELPAASGAMAVKQHSAPDSRPIPATIVTRERRDEPRRRCAVALEEDAAEEEEEGRGGALARAPRCSPTVGSRRDARRRR